MGWANGRRRVRAGAVLAGLAVAAAVFAVAANVTATTDATLTVFLGQVQVLHGAHAAAQPGRTGDQVPAGATVVTGDGARAALTFPDGSVTRLDAETRVSVAHLERVTGGSDTRLYQTAGKTWNRVVRLTGGARFEVQAPNSSTAEVRGTEFSVEVGSGAAPVLFAVWSGAVDVSAQKGRVALTAGQETSVAAGSPPAPPTAIEDGVRRDAWTVFNTGLDQASGAVVAVFTGTASSGDVDGPYDASNSHAGDLSFSLAWPGSRFALRVRAPDGTIAGEARSGQPPVTVEVPNAAAGTWTVEVTDIESAPGEPWAVVVSRAVRTTPTSAPATSTASSAPTAAASPSTASPQPGATTSSSNVGPSPTAGATPSAGATPTPTPVPGPGPTVAPTPTPAPTAAPTAAPLAITVPLSTLQAGWKVGSPHSVRLTASGGTLPYRWSSVGTLPPGLAFKQGTAGQLDGTPIAAGTYAFTLVVTDAGNQSAQLPAVIVVSP